jgi:predicted RecB family nuclease
MAGPKIVVFDIETSPNLVYSWGLWQQNIAINQIVEPQDILCFAAHHVGTKKIEAHAAWDDRDAMLKRLWTLMDEADYLVGYNHVGFDNKHVRAQFAAAGMTPPSPHRDIDLLRVVKKQFRFPSHKLDYVCRALGLDVKVSTGGMDLWTRCMNGDEKAQQKMLRYNRQDVRITTQLFNRLLPWIDNLNVPLFDSGGTATATSQDVARCTRCGGTRIQKRGMAHATAHSYQRFKCMECGGWMKSAKSIPRVNTELLRNA